MTMSPVLYSSASEEWPTPRRFFARLDRQYHFTLDPCATPDNAVCALYFTKEQDGLAQDWGSHRVFCNPPYGKQIGRWVRKCFEASQAGARVVLFVPARTDTRWFHDWVHGKAKVTFVRGRVRFGNADTCAPFPSMLAIYSPPTKRARKMNDRIVAREVRAIRRLQKSATTHGKRFLADIVEIGKRLDRVKERVGHGNWIPWLRNNFKMSGDTAANYVSLFKLSQSPEFRKFRNLPLDILYWLGRKSTPPEKIAEVARRIEAGERPAIITAEVRQGARGNVTVAPSVRTEVIAHDVEVRAYSTTPEPSDEQLADGIWRDVIEFGQRPDWRKQLDASLSALEPAQALSVRGLLREKINAQIEQLAGELERLRKAVDYLRPERPPLSVVSTETPTKH
jgi:phage N-6-adenine-methyltransferase